MERARISLPTGTKFFWVYIYLQLPETEFREKIMKNKNILNLEARNFSKTYPILVNTQIKFRVGSVDNLKTIVAVV